MKGFEHDHARWLDDEMSESERAAFEQKLGPTARREKAAWEAIRGRLRAESATMDARAEFLTTRVRAALEERPHLGFPSKLAWLGSAFVAAAALLAFIGLPRVFRPLAPEQFISQVVATQVEDPRLAVYTFQAPESRGSVLWVVGSDFIPAEETVR